MAMRPCIHESRQRSTCCGPAWRLAAIRRRCCRPLSLRQENSFMNRKHILILLAAATVLTATVLYAGWLRRDTALQGSGTVEARNIRVGSKIGGRIHKVLVHEGDSVQPGQNLITFHHHEFPAPLQQSRHSGVISPRGDRPE